MKRLIITAAIMLAMGMAAQAQAQKNVTIVRNGKTFVATKSNEKGTYEPTGYWYIDTDGTRCEIHVHTTTKGKNAGVTRCYIQRISKNTGKPYWKVIDVKPEELKED